MNRAPRRERSFRSDQMDGVVTRIGHERAVPRFEERSEGKILEFAGRHELIIRQPERRRKSTPALLRKRR